jgi:hypothetical protein
MSKPEVRQTYNGAVAARWEVVLPFTSEEDADKLRAALAVVQRYQEQAARLAKVRVGKNGNCNWVMYGFAVKNDRVLVEVQTGACG